MTVAELIETLKAFPADLEVVVEGYETGLDPIHLVKQADITGKLCVIGSKLDEAGVAALFGV